LQIWKAVEELLYHTSEKEIRVWHAELRQEEIHNCPEVKSNTPFVDYRSSGTGFHID